MNFFGRVICLASFIIPIPALCGWGSLSDARAKHPSLFKPNVVLELEINGIRGYAYTGSVKQNFKGDSTQPDSVLYRRAALIAKRNLINFLLGKDKSRSVEMSENQIVYQYPEDTWRTVVCFVPRNKVSIIDKRVALSQSPDAFSPDIDIQKTNSAQKCESKVSPLPRLEVHGDTNPVAATIDAGVKAECAADVAKDSLPQYTLGQCLQEISKKPSPEMWSQAAQICINNKDMEQASFAYSNLVELVKNEKDKDLSVEWIMEAAEFEEGRGNYAIALRYYRLIVSQIGVKDKETLQLVAKANSKIAELLVK